MKKIDKEKLRNFFKISSKVFFWKTNGDYFVQIEFGKFGFVKTLNKADYNEIEKFYRENYQ